MVRQLFPSEQSEPFSRGAARSVWRWCALTTAEESGVVSMSRKSTYISQSRIRILAVVVKEGDHAQETVGQTHNIALLKDTRPIEELVSRIVAHATGLALSRHARIGGSRRA